MSEGREIEELIRWFAGKREPARATVAPDGERQAASAPEVRRVATGPEGGEERMPLPA